MSLGAPRRSRLYLSCYEISSTQSQGPCPAFRISVSTFTAFRRPCHQHAPSKSLRYWQTLVALRVRLDLRFKPERRN